MSRKGRRAPLVASIEVDRASLQGHAPIDYASLKITAMGGEGVNKEVDGLSQAVNEDVDMTPYAGEPMARAWPAYPEPQASPDEPAPDQTAYLPTDAAGDDWTPSLPILRALSRTDGFDAHKVGQCLLELRPHLDAAIEAVDSISAVWLRGLKEDLADGA
jgi:hypothetical protein